MQNFLSPNDERFIGESDSKSIQNAIGGSAGFLITFLISPLVQHIQNNGNNFFGINVYAQQVISLIALLIEIFAIIYIVRCVVPLTRIRGKITYD